jgi:hypothetical protein
MAELWQQMSLFESADGGACSTMEYLNSVTDKHFTYDKAVVHPDNFL